jgi:hypothetical protein
LIILLSLLITVGCFLIEDNGLNIYGNCSYKTKKFSFIGGVAVLFIYIIIAFVTMNHANKIVPKKPEFERKR